MTFDRVIAVRNTKTVYRNGEICIKVFNEGFKKSEILSEAESLARMEETGMAVPELLEVKMIEGKWAIVTRYVKGKTLALMIAENPDGIDDYIDRFADIHRDIITRKCRYLDRLTDKLNTKICDSKLAATLRYDLHARLYDMPQRDNICHGDFNPTNVIVSDDNEAYIVDWSCVSRGNMLADIAKTYLEFLVDMNDDVAEKYIDAMCRKLNIGRERIENWIPIIAVSSSVSENRERRTKLMNIYKNYSQM